MNISNERGSVVVLVAVMLFLIFMCVALVVDIGHIHNVKIELQRAVDAAALAGAQQIPDDNAVIVASAVAMGNANQVDNDAVTINAADVVPGWWETKIIPGETAFDRFTAGGTTINAVKVTATLDVPHFFFFPVDDTKVTADAIAVYQTINPVLPLAVVTCIPTDPTEVPPGTLRDMTICGIKSFDFNSNGNDDGAWTSLTFPANANDIGFYMNEIEGRERFNSVIYGRDLNNDGIENTSVTTTGTCPPPTKAPFDDIKCGLGSINGKEIAPPDEFPAPVGWNSPLSIGVTPAVRPTFDPLTAYAANGALPRWYNLNNDDEFKTDDHFTRIWSQDGILLPAIGEDYNARMKSYYDGTVKPFGDDRFANAGGKMIVRRGQTYKPDYKKILEQTGYPQVNIINGVLANIIPTFISNTSISDSTNLLCRDDDALPSGQQAVILKSPVIFIGECGPWSAIDTAPYVGMAKFLLTRAWGPSSEYDCGSNFVNVGGCPTVFSPPAVGGLLEATGSTSPTMIEGLTLLPTADGEETNASLIRIFLVE